MGQWGLKVRRHVLPLAALAVVLTAVYSALNVLFVAGGGPVALDEDVADLWLPGVLAFALVLRVVQPGLKSLALNDKRGMPFLYVLLATAVIGVPLVLLQLHIAASAGRLAHVGAAGDVSHAARAKFYAIGNACFDRSRAVADAVFADDDDRGDEMSVTFYIAVPACGTAQVWLGLTYRDLVSNRISDAAQKAKVDAFARQSDAALAAEDFARYPYFERAGNNAGHRAFDKALRKNGAPAGAVVLLPRTGAFADRADRRLPLALLSAAGLWLAWLIAVLAAPLRTTPPPQTAPLTGPGFAAVLVPTRWNYGLPLLMDVNILVYLCMVMAGLGVMSFPADDLVDWGAASRPLIHGLGIFRLITCQFVHGGLLHLANNMTGLLFGAMCLAPAVRNARLILCYVVCGLGGSIASVTHSVTVSVGASGAIFGIYAILLVLYGLKDARIRALGPGVWTTAAIFVGLNLVFGFVSPTTDNAAHVGGALAGLVLGGAIFLIDRPRRRTGG